MSKKEQKKREKEEAERVLAELTGDASAPADKKEESKTVAPET